MSKIVEKLLRAGEGRIIKKLHGIAAQVNAIEEDFEKLTDAELRAETDVFRKRLADGESLDDILPEAFAAVREASKRTLGKRHFDVQLMGGAALHLGNVAEMKTGEGKTLVATLPSYLNALEGKGVHVVTVNDYLAEYQSELMGRVHRMLGLETGVILASMTPEQRRVEYAKDITYGTNNEFGFDYLRDNMAWSMDELVQRGHNFAIVDEVDSILIDEARTPLIISGPADAATKWYTEFSRIAELLTRGELESGEGDYEVDEKKKTVGVLEAGIAKVEDYLGIDNLYESVNTPADRLPQQRHQGQGAVQARQGLRQPQRRDPHRRRAHRPHARGAPLQRGHAPGDRGEGGRRDPEREPDARHDHPAELLPHVRQALGHDRHGQTEAAELYSIYKLGVVPIPTNRPMIRKDQPDLVYRTEEAKFAAVVDDIVERHAEGQPVLVGTVSVEKSEYLSDQLRRRGVPHEVLNAKQHEREAAIVAQAGPQGRRHRGHQHGRSRHRHHARWQPRVHGRGHAEAAWARSRGDPGGVRGGLGRGAGQGRGGRPGRARRGHRSWAASTCWAPSATSRAASTTSCVVVPAARATRASRGSTCRSRTT